MNRIIVGALVLVFAQSAFAAKLTSVKRLTNSSLEQLSNAADKEAYLTQGSYRVVTKTPAKGRSVRDVRQATVAQAAHMVCAFFDDGVSLSHVKSASSAVDNLTDSNTPDEKIHAEMVKSLEKAQDGNIEIYSGNASGNNTGGTVLGVYDLDNDEILVIANTNCGSDN